MTNRHDTQIRRNIDLAIYSGALAAILLWKRTGKTSEAERDASRPASVTSRLISERIPERIFPAFASEAISPGEEIQLRALIESAETAESAPKAPTRLARVR